jgi:hypothetical protein
MEDKHVRILLEDIRSQFRAFGEGQQDIQRQLKDIRGMTAKNSENIEIIKLDIAFIKTELKKFIRVEEFSALEKRVALVERKLSRI